MKKNSLLLWILIPISCMTNYIVYAEAVDPLDPGIVVEEPTPTDLIEPDPVPDQTIQDEEVPVDVWAEEEPVAPSEEPVGPWEEPVDSLLDPVETGETQPIGGGLQSALGGLQSATPPMTTPTSTGTTDEQSNSSTSNGTSEEPQTDQPVITNTTSSNLIDPTSTGTSEEPQTDQPVIANTTSSNLIDLISTGTDEQSNSSTSNQTANTSSGTSGESQINQPVIANTTSSNLIDLISTGTDEQSNSSTSNQTANTSSGTSGESQINQPVITNTTSGNLIDLISTGTDEQSNSSTSNQTANTSNSISAESQTNQPVITNMTSGNLNESGTLIENSIQTSSPKNGNTIHFNSSQSNLSSSTSSNNTTSKTSSTQSKSNVSTTTSTTTHQNNSLKTNKDISTKSTTADNTDDNNTSTNSSVQDNNASTTTDKNPSGNSNLSKVDPSTAPKISPVSSSNTQQEKALNESNNELGIQTSADENESQLSAPKSSPAVETKEESGTTQLQNDRVVIVADNSVLPNTFSVDAQIGPHQVFLINIGEGYSKPEVVEHLSNSQVFIKENLLTYVPHLGFVGIDTFSYQVTDPEGNRLVKQVRVKVTAKDELVPVKNCQLYFVNDGDDSDSQFLTMVPTSKMAIKLGPEYYTFDIEGIAIHPTNGLLYATSGGGRQNIFDGYLYRVNPETGGVTIIGDTDYSEISSLAFRPDGTLWSWSRNGSKDKSKPAGLIKIDLITAQSQLIFPSPVDIEGLTWDSEGKVLYGTEQTQLWAFDGKELRKQCSNFSSEVESLETSVNGMLLFGTNEHNGNSVRLYDPAICEEITGDSFATPSITGIFDIESLAWPLECQSAMTKTTRSDKDSNSTKTSNAVSDNNECTDKDNSNCAILAEVDNQKTTRNSKKVTPQPATTCPSDAIEPCPALKSEEAQRFFTDTLKADFVQLDPDGLVFVSLNEQLHYGFFSYSLSAEQVRKLKLKSVYEVACEKDENSVAQLKLSLTKDIDSEGHSDFVITYCDGQAQMLFYLGITDSVFTGTDDIETSNPIKKEDVKTKKDNSNPTKN